MAASCVHSTVNLRDCNKARVSVIIFLIDIKEDDSLHYFRYGLSTPTLIFFYQALLGVGATRVYTHSS